MKKIQEIHNVFRCVENEYMGKFIDFLACRLKKASSRCTVFSGQFQEDDWFL